MPLALTEVSTLDLEEMQLPINLNLTQHPASASAPSSNSSASPFFFFFLPPFDLHTSQDSTTLPFSAPNPIYYLYQSMINQSLETQIPSNTKDHNPQMGNSQMKPKNHNFTCQQQKFMIPDLRNRSEKFTIPNQHKKKKSRVTVTAKSKKLN